jgi:hypothetical protein
MQNSRCCQAELHFCKRCAVVYLRDLVGVEVKQQLFLVVTTEKNNFLGGSRRQHSLDCRPKKLEHTRCIEQQAAAEALRVEILN